MGPFVAFDDQSVTHTGAGTTAALIGPWGRRLVGGSPIDATTRARNQRWHDNCAVTSCEEYLREAFYDYAVFEDRIAGLGDDWRAIFEAAYDAEGIAGRSLERFATGRSLPVAIEGRDFKNQFFNHRPWIERALPWAGMVALGVFPDVPATFFTELPVCQLDEALNQFDCGADLTLNQHRALSALNEILVQLPADLYARLETEPAGGPPRDADRWQWHRQQSDALAGFSDERLLWLDRRQQAFLEVRSDRARLHIELIELADKLHFVMADNTDAGPQVRARYAEPFRAQLYTLALRLQVLDTEVIEHLRFAEAQGCLAEGTTPCDWSPRWPAEALRGQLVRQRAEALTTCHQRTANNFAWLHDADGQGWLREQPGDLCTVRGEHVSGCVVRDSYVADTRSVEQYFTTVQAWLDGLQFDRDPETGAVIVGRSGSDLQSVGDRKFGVDFNFDASWALDGIASADPCASRMMAVSGMSVDAHAFGYAASALFGGDALASADVTTPPEGSRADTVVDLELFGNALYQGESWRNRRFAGESEGARFSFYFSKAPTYRRSASEKGSAVIGVVPVVYEGGIAGQASLALNVERTGVRCPADADPFDGSDRLSTRIEPYLSATAFAEAGVGVPGASFGVRGDITLLRLGFPLVIEGGYTAADGGTLDVTMGAQQTVTVLQGSISLVLEFIWDTYTRRLFGWRGPSWSHPLFGDRLRGPLLTLINAFDQEDGVRLRRAAEFDPELSCDVPEPVVDPDVYFDFDDEHSQAGALSAAIGDAHLRWTAGVQTGQPGVHGQAYDLAVGADLTYDGPDRRVQGFTYSLWFRPDVPTGTLLALGEIDDRVGLRVRVRDQNHLTFQVLCGDRLFGQLIRGEFWDFDGRWSHLALTYDGNADRLQVYVDGALITSKAQCDIGHTGRTRVLGRGLDGGEPFVGGLDDFAWWDGTILNPEQIRELSNRGRAGRPVAGSGAARPTGVTALRAAPFDDRVQLSWTNPPNLGAGAYDYVELRGSQARYPTGVGFGELVYQGALSEAIHAGLAPDQVWYYAAFAVAEDGTATRGPVAYARTVSAPPAPVAGFVAQGQVGHARLRWTPPEAADVAQVVIRRSALRAPQLDEGWVVYRGLGTETTDLNLAAGPWHYSAFTYDWFGNVSVPATARADVLGREDIELLPPPNVVDLVATPRDAAVALSWAPDGAPPAHWRVTRMEADGWRQALVYEGALPEFDDVGLINGRAYQYVVQAVDRVGRPGAPAAILVTPSAGDKPNPLAGFRVRASGEAIELRWNEPLDPAAQIVVRRSTQVAPDAIDRGVEIYRGRGPRRLDAAVIAGRTYYYAAFVLDAAGQISAAVTGSARAVPNDVAPPPPVIGLAAEAGPGRVRLAWTNPPTPDLDVVEVRVAAGAPPPDGGAVLYAGRGTYATHADAEPGTEYTYTVTTVDFAGNRGAPRVVQATPLALPGPVAEVGADQHTLGGVWIWLDGAASVAGDEPRYTWTQVAGPAVSLIAQGTDARFLAPEVDDELRFELTVRDALGVSRATTRVFVAPAGDLALPEINDDVTISPFEVSLRANDALLVAHEPQSMAVHLLNPRTGASLNTIDFSAGEFVFLDGDRAGFLGQGQQLYGWDLSDPDNPIAVAPLPLSFRFGGHIHATDGLVAAYNPNDGSLRVAAQTPEGWAVRFDTQVPNEQPVRALVVQDGVAYLALAARPELPEAIIAVSLEGDAPVWSAAVPLPAHNTFRLVAQAGRLAVLALPNVQGGNLRIFSVDLSAPMAPAAPVLLAGGFAQPDRFQGLRLVGDRLFGVGFSRPHAVDVLTLTADTAEAGPAFSGPQSAGAFALWPPAGPTHLWIPAEGFGAAPGVARAHQLGALMAPWWPLSAAHNVSAVAVSAARDGLALAAGQTGVGTWRLVDGALQPLGWVDWPEPLYQAPEVAALNNAGGLVVTPSSPIDAQVRRIGIDADGQPLLSAPVNLPTRAYGAWALDTRHVLLDLGHVGLQVWDINGAEPVSAGPAFGAQPPDNMTYAKLGAYDPATRQAIAVVENGEWQRYDLADPTDPLLMDRGWLEPSDDPFMPPMFFLQDTACRASFTGGQLTLITSERQTTYPIVLGPGDAGLAVSTTAAFLPPGRLHIAPELGLWATLGEGALRWWYVVDGQLTERRMGAVMLPAGHSPAPLDGASFATHLGGPHGWAFSDDGRAWIAAGPSGLVSIDLAGPRLDGPDGSPIAGDVARWQARWRPAAGLVPTCTVSAGECDFEAIDLEAGTATIRWSLADPGPAALRLRLAHAGADIQAEIRTHVEAPQ